jgi:hypothetical protein
MRMRLLLIVLAAALLGASVYAKPPAVAPAPEAAQITDAEFAQALDAALRFAEEEWKLTYVLSPTDQRTNQALKALRTTVSAEAFAQTGAAVLPDGYAEITEVYVEPDYAMVYLHRGLADSARHCGDVLLTRVVRTDGAWKVWYVDTFACPAGRQKPAFPPA